ncbi:GLPGLI family protein [soil metagenome]
MKQPLWIAAILITSTVFSQVKEGKVTYERKMNMHKDMPPEAEQFKAMVPEFTTSKMELLFNSSQSLFHPVANEVEDEMPQPGGDGGRRIIRFGGMDAETFRDYEKEQIVEARELGPKKYIIDDTLKPLKWKMEEDTMTIMGYLCHKATTSQAMRMGRPGFMPGTDTSTNKTPPPPQQQPVVAWYTEAIESQAGPDNFYGLPGLILKTDLNNGTMVYTATSFEKLDKDLVKAPANGKKITREAYRKMMQEQMGGPGGPGGGPVIRIVQ